MRMRLLYRQFRAILCAVAVACIAAVVPGFAQQSPDRFEVGFPGGDPPGRVGRLSFVSNLVSLRGYGDTQWAPASLNYPVTTGTAIWTEPNALAEIRIADTAVRLNNGTEVEFVALDDRQVHAFVKQGAVHVQIRSFPQDDSYEISTPRGTVRLFGRGYYRIDAGTEREPTRVAVTGEGTARVIGEGIGVTVNPGDVALISGVEGLRIELRRAELDQFDRWAMARDPLTRPVQSARYVPADVTGYEDLDQYGNWVDEPDYGPVWYPRAVPAAWVPYRFGYWSYVWPWGWTWIDYAPWGFAPFHYGRWVHIRNRWCWFPGHIHHRPIFAPALVAFVGGPGFRMGTVGPSVGWFPLGPHDRYKPWFKASQGFVENVNVTRPTRPGVGGGNTGEHPHRQWATLVEHSDFVRGRPVGSAEQQRRSPTEIATAPILDLRPDALPRPERGRLQPTAAAPPPVNLRGGTVPGFKPGADVQSPQVQPRSAGPGAPSPRDAPFNRERFERFRDRNPAAFGTPPDATPRSNRTAPPTDQTPRQVQPPSTPPRPDPFPRRNEPVVIQRGPSQPQFEAPRPTQPIQVPQIQSPPTPTPPPRQEFRAPAPQPSQPPQQQRNDDRRRDRRNGI